MCAQWALVKMFFLRKRLCVRLTPLVIVVISTLQNILIARLHENTQNPLHLNKKHERVSDETTQNQSQKNCYQFALPLVARLTSLEGASKENCNGINGSLRHLDGDGDRPDCPSSICREILNKLLAIVLAYFTSSLKVGII